MSRIDPLEGFRARTPEEDDQNEELVRNIRGLAENGIDYRAISDVIAAEDVVRALHGDTTLAKLASHCAGVITENSYAWSVSNEPEKLVGKHLETRAARMVIAWIESIEQTGKVAEQLIQQQDISEDD
jgi:hypothetical protein